VLVQIGYTTNSLLQAAGPSRLLFLPFFPVVLASLLMLLVVVQNFYKKETLSLMFIKRQPMKIIN